VRRVKRIHLHLGVAAVAAVVVLAAAPAAQGARSQIGAPVNVMLHVGSHGQRVKDLQWLLAGHDPNTFSSVRPTFHWKPNGYFGPRTAAAVKQYKWKLGYPGNLVKPIAGPYLFDLLTGKANRPIRWVALAAHRLSVVAAAPTAIAVRIKTLEISQLGVTEVPLGSNRGPQVTIYQRATGAYGLAWCVSFQQWSFLTGGYGTFAFGTASVYYAVDWAQPRGLLRARPKVGAIVAFIDYDHAGHRIPGTGHMGYVVKTTASGFVYIAGNDGNAVREHFLENGTRSHVFIYLPGLTV
jgi:hypothetical protein